MQAPSRTERASGSSMCLHVSVMRIRVGSTLAPAPADAITGMPRCLHVASKSTWERNANAVVCSGVEAMCVCSGTAKHIRMAHTLFVRTLTVCILIILSKSMRCLCKPQTYLGVDVVNRVNHIRWVVCQDGVTGVCCVHSHHGLYSSFRNNCLGR